MHRFNGVTFLLQLLYAGVKRDVAGNLVAYLLSIFELDQAAALRPGALSNQRKDFPFRLALADAPTTDFGAEDDLALGARCGFEDAAAGARRILPTACRARSG